MRFILLIVISIYMSVAQQPVREHVVEASNRSIKKNIYWPNNYVWVLEGDLIIEKGATLQIQAGTTIKFRPNTDVTGTGKDPRRSEIIVLGELIAEGEPSSNQWITFTSGAKEGNQRSGDWYGITIYRNPGTRTTLRNTRIEFAHRGINCIGSSPYIRNNQIVNNFNTGIYLTSKSQAVLESNLIQDNGYAGVEVRNLSNPKLYLNIIRRNEYGVMVYDSSEPLLGRVRMGNKNLRVGSSDYLIGQNIISDNFEYEIYNASSKTIYAQNNSWSDQQLVKIDQSVYDRDEQSSYGDVVIAPIVSISEADLEALNLQDQVVASATPRRRNTRSTRRVQNQREQARKAIAQQTNLPTRRTTPVATSQSLTVAQNENANRKQSQTSNQTTSTGSNQNSANTTTQAATNQPAKTDKPAEDTAPNFTQQSLVRPFIDAALERGTGTAINQPTAVASDLIRTQGIRGRVIVRLTVGTDGKVVQAQVLKSAHPLLETPSIEAAQKYQFSVGKIQGQPVQFYKTVFFRF